MPITRGHALALLVAGCLCPLPLFAAEMTLVYKDGNKWVAPEDNKPLIKLMKAARSGTTVFKVRLPAAERPLSIERLQVLQDILAREAKAGVLIEESSGTVPAGTLHVSY